jgi:hypothetical protein
VFVTQLLALFKVYLSARDTRFWWGPVSTQAEYDF